MAHAGQHVLQCSTHTGPCELSLALDVPLAQALVEGKTLAGISIPHLVAQPALDLVKLTQRWSIGLDVEKRAVKCTTQHGIWSKLYPMLSH